MADKSTRILVLLREACDPKPPVRLSADGFGVDDRGLRRVTNPADLSALEMALQLTAQQQGTVTAVAIGPKRLNDHLRLALAMGADRAVRVWSSALQGGDAAADAHLVARLIEIVQPDLVFAGNRLIDRGDDPAPALAAARLGIVSAPTQAVRASSCLNIERRLGMRFPGCLWAQAAACTAVWRRREPPSRLHRRPGESLEARAGGSGPPA